MFQKQVEAPSMVTMTQVAEFVQKDIVTEHSRKTDDIQVQINVAQSRTTAPVRGVMLDGHAVIFKSIPRGEDGQTGRQFGLCLTAQNFDLMGISLLDTLVAFLLTSHSLDDPFAFEFEKCDCCGEWQKVGYRHADTPDRMNTDSHTTDTLAFAEGNGAKGWVCVYLFHRRLPRRDFVPPRNDVKRFMMKL
jgi:hypothetical protein